MDLQIWDARGLDALDGTTDCCLVVETDVSEPLDGFLNGVFRGQLDILRDTDVEKNHVDRGPCASNTVDHARR